MMNRPLSEFDPIRITRAHIRRQSAPLFLNYEVDLWGKFRKAYESAVDIMEAEWEYFKTTYLILTTDVAFSYYRARHLDAEIEFYLKEIEALETALDIANSRYELQADDYSPVARAQLDLSNTKASYEEALRGKLNNKRTSVLMGMPASTFTSPSSSLRRFSSFDPCGHSFRYSTAKTGSC